MDIQVRVDENTSFYTPEGEWMILLLSRPAVVKDQFIEYHLTMAGF